MAEIKTSDILNASEISKDLQDIIDKFNQLLAAMKQTSGEFQKSTNSTKKMTEADKKAAEEKKQQIAAEKELIDAQKALQKQRQAGLAAMAKEEFKRRELIATATMEAKGLGELEAKLSAMKKIYRGMPQDTEKAKAAAERYSAAIRELDKVVKKGGEGLGEYQRYVGNYERGLMGLDMSFGQAGNSFADFDRDVTQYRESTKTAGFSTDNLEKSVNKMPNALASMAVGITAAIAVITKLTQSVQQSIDAFLRQEDANDMVNDVFGEYSSVINQAANDTQKFTKIGNEQYQELAVQAKNFGIANKDVNQTVRDAIGLADLYGSAGANEELMLEALIDAQNGKTKGLEKYVKELRGVTDEEERNRILQEKIAQGWLMASTAGATYGDQLTMIKNAAGDLQEEIGKQVLEGVLGSPSEIGKVKEQIENMIAAMERTGVISKTLQNIKGIYESLIQPIADLAKRLGIASDNTELFEVVLRGVGKVFEFLLTPIKLIYNNVGTMITFWVGLYDILSNIKDAKFEDIFTLIKQTAFDLISPLTDLIGVSDEVAAMFGAQTAAIKMTREELDKLNVLSGQYTKNVKDMAKAQVDANAAAEEEKELTEEQLAAIEDAKKAHEDWIAAKAKANEESKLSIALGNSELEVESKKLQAIYDATKAYYESNGYTNQEIKELQELKKQISDVNAAIAEIQWNEELSKWIQNDIENVNKLLKNIEVGTTKITFKAEIPEEETEDLSKKFTLSFGEKLKKAFKNSKGFAEAIKSFFGDEQVGEAAQGIVDAMGTIGEATDTVFDRQLAKIDAAAKKNADYWDSLMKNYDQDSAEYQQLLAQKEAAQEQYQARLVELERKKAAFDKVKALIDIAINTAMGIISALGTTPPNPILAGAIGVAGAVQAGVVASQPLPQYYVGLDSADKDHFGSVAERGAELVNYPDGTSELFTKPTITFIPKYTSIDTAAETAKKLAGAQFTADLTELNNSSRESIKYLGIIARNTQTRQSATDIHYINKYLK